MARTAKELAEYCRMEGMNYEQTCKCFQFSAYRGFYKTFKQLQSAENWEQYLKEKKEVKK